MDPTCGDVVCFTAATLPAMSFPEMVWRMRSDLQNLRTTRQHTATTNRITEAVRNGSQETHTHEQLSCRRQRSPIAIVYRFGERARITMRPQTKCARSQGTTSPQICVTFRHFNSQPIIWHRGPRPRAHWYMCADAANFQNHHNYSPLSTSDVLITQTFSSGELSSRRYCCSCPG